uniref:(northern house mosquito) hypothetical protein n=1 Tax=Culex pipiens TaxID=7175 RepID=A0A8D8KZI1_CULPI
MKNFFRFSELFLRFFSKICCCCSSSSCRCCSSAASSIMFSLLTLISISGAGFLKSSCEDTRRMTSPQFGRCSSLFDRISFRSWLMDEVLSWRSLRFRQFCHSDELIRLGKYCETVDIAPLLSLLPPCCCSRCCLPPQSPPPLPQLPLLPLSHPSSCSVCAEDKLAVVGEITVVRRLRSSSFCPSEGRRMPHTQAVTVSQTFLANTSILGGILRRNCKNGPPNASRRVAAAGTPGSGAASESTTV